MANNGPDREEINKALAAVNEPTGSPGLSNLINIHGSFSIIPGQLPEDKTTVGDVFSAAWHDGATGGLVDFIKQQRIPPEEDLDPNYNFMPDVDDEFFNPDDIQYFVNSRSQQETQYINQQLRNEKYWLEVRQDRPWSYMGASILADPVGMFIPSIKGGSTIKAGYKAAVAASLAEKSALGAIAKATGKAGIATGVSSGLAATAIESIQQQTKISKDIADSAFDVAGATILGAVIGTAGGGLMSAVGYKSALSHINNALADIPDVPNPVKSKLFVLGPIEYEISKSNDRVAKLPDWVVNGIVASDMNKMLTSEFKTMNYAGQLLFSHGHVTDKNIIDGLPNPRNIEDDIFANMAQFQGAMVKFDKLFRESLGVGEGPAEGLRARMALAMKKGGMNTQLNHEAVARALDSNIPSNNETVNRQVEVIRNDIIRPIKEALVATNQMHPKFLDKEFDAWFGRMWKQNLIAKDPNGMRALTLKWYKEVRDFYRTNQDEIARLNKPVEAAREKLAKKEREIAAVNSKRLKRANRKFTAKEQANYNAMRKELEVLRKNLEKELTPLYNFFPKKEYIPADGHIPSPKDDKVLGENSWQTIQRILGTDLESQMNPYARTGEPGANPLAARVLQMPNDYTADVIDPDGTARTVSTFDFIEKDVHKVMSNFIRKTVPKYTTQQRAMELGFETFEDLKANMFSMLNEEYKIAVKGKTGRAASRITNNHKKSSERLKRAFATLDNVTNAEVNIYGPGMKKLIKHLNEYTEKRLLGSAMLSSIADAGIAVLRQNFDGFTNDWLLPFARSVVKLQKNKAKMINAQTAAEWGFAVNTEIGKTIKPLMNNEDLLIPHQWWGQFAETLSSPFGNATGINQFEDMVSNMAFSASVSKTMRIIDRNINGKRVTKRDKLRNLAIGISKEDERIIYDMWREAVGPTGGKDGTVYYADPGKWDVNTPERAAAYANFRNATTRDFRQSKLRTTAGDRVPGSDTTAMRTILKFKDYLFAAHNKALLPIMQKIGSREADVLFGISYVMSLASLSYVLTSLAKDPTGESLDLSPGNLFKESLDRSGILGILLETTNLFAKTGWLPWGETSRWQSRGIFGSVLGPTAGIIDDLLVSGGRLAQSQIWGNTELKEKDIMNLLRLLPYQNLFYLRYLNEQITRGIAGSLGASE